jgi:hypothetical protein
MFLTSGGGTVIIEGQAAKSAADIIRQSLPEAIYLFASFFRRRAQKFHVISEHGNLWSRMSLTGALALICALSSYLVTLLDPFSGIEGIMGPYQRAAWAALVPLITVPPICWILRRQSGRPIFSTFLNLGLVTSTALMVIPSVIVLAGANASALNDDVIRLRAGRAQGRPVHTVYCGSIQRRVEIAATMRDLARNMERLKQNMRTLQFNGQQLMLNRQEVDAAGRRMLTARASGRPEDAERTQLFEAMERGQGIMERGLQIQDRGLSIQRSGIDTMEKSIDLENEQTMAPLRLVASYPVAATFLGIGVVAAILIWVFAAVIAWRLIVSTQPTRMRKVILGGTIVVLFTVLWIGFGLLRSGLIEALIQESPDQEMMLAQIKDEVSEAKPMCGRLNNYGLW